MISDRKVYKEGVRCNKVKDKKKGIMKTSMSNMMGIASK
jgi:hypothetical protein